MATARRGHWVSTLEEAAEAAAALARGESWNPPAFPRSPAIRSRLSRASATGPRGGRSPRALHRGHARPRGAVPDRAAAPARSLPRARARRRRALILDLGADEFTRGRPHPMIDPSGRAGLVREAGRRADVGMLLIDLVLGRAATRIPRRRARACDPRGKAGRLSRGPLARRRGIGRGNRARPSGPRGPDRAARSGGRRGASVECPGMPGRARCWLQPELRPSLFARGAMSPEALLGQPLQVINVGLEVFAGGTRGRGRHGGSCRLAAAGRRRGRGGAAGAAGRR